MTKSNALLLAAFLMASTSPVAVAQTGTGTGTEMRTGAVTGGSVGTEVPGTPTTGDGATGTGMDSAAPSGGDTASESRHGSGYQHIVVSLNASAAMDQDWATRLDGVSDDTEVTVLQRSEIEASEGVDATMLDEALSDLEEDQDAMRSAVEEHQALADALEAEGYAAEDVVGLVVYGGTASEVFVIVEGDGSI